MIFKLDLAKAYDRVLQLFILKVLRKFEFNEWFIDIIWRLISNCQYFVLIDGKLGGFFKSARGVRQRDPLSPSLFIIAFEVVSRGLKDLEQTKKTFPFSIPFNFPSVSYLAYADDTVIFSNGLKSSLQNLMQFLYLYEVDSGHLINKNKNCFILGDKLSPRRSQSDYLSNQFQQEIFTYQILGIHVIFWGGKRFPILMI